MLLIKTTTKLAPVGDLGRQEGDDLCSVLPLPPVVPPDVAQGLSGTGLSDVPIHSAASSKLPIPGSFLSCPLHHGPGPHLVSLGEAPFAWSSLVPSTDLHLNQQSDKGKCGASLQRCAMLSAKGCF